MLLVLKLYMKKKNVVERKKPENASDARAKSVTKESGASQPGARTPAHAKSVEAKPKETVSEEESTKTEAAKEETVEEVTDEEVVIQKSSTLHHEKTLGPPPIERAEYGVHAMSYHTTEPASNAVPLTIADYHYPLGATHEELDSKFLSLHDWNQVYAKKRNKGEIFENNYYEEYEKELAMYDSKETFLDSETDQLYLN
ncbi:CYIR protein [Plasmodium cynomolgi strain B]|uniref:CYIR protein n=1 Tax=Plasmodium cynomolgi (strain B) TaxID=1120755 RepID=K6VJL7_PLACD|nr:CYIR protein [Plasmodium cynomolgi strain B]GAB69602.1 CYIR protein [Plasmodium cynomolgi strain B]